MNFKAIAEVEIVEKTSASGYVYQVIQVTFDNGKAVVIHGDPKDILRIIYAMNEN